MKKKKCDHWSELDGLITSAKQAEKALAAKVPAKEMSDFLLSATMTELTELTTKQKPGENWEKKKKLEMMIIRALTHEMDKDQIGQMGFVQSRISGEENPNPEVLGFGFSASFWFSFVFCFSSSSSFISSLHFPPFHFWNLCVCSSGNLLHPPNLLQWFFSTCHYMGIRVIWEPQLWMMIDVASFRLVKGELPNTWMKKQIWWLIKPQEGQTKEEQVQVTIYESDNDFLEAN